MRDHILLYVNGRRHEVRAADAFLPLSEFLRERLSATGTKIVCAEGDCGSCTVLLGRCQDGTLRYQPVCSCIQYLFQLDCTHIITVEGLRQGDELHPVQESLVNCHGSQCGFCTPGFAVALASVLDENLHPTRSELRRALVGNLCRCTGYEAILDAGLNVDAAALRPLAAAFDTSAIAADLSTHESETVRLQCGDKTLCKPASASEAVQFLVQHPAATVVAGGTDLGVQSNKGMREFTTVLALSGLRELQSLSVSDTEICAGAGVSIAELETAARRALPEYARLLDYFGSPQIKNAGTLGGNIANGSPIGDTMPALFVLGARIDLLGPTGTRSVDINDFYTGYRRSVRAADELIAGVRIPLPGPDEVCRFYKVSRRKDLDISAFTAAFLVRRAGDTIAEVRIAFGGVAATIVRLPRTEAFLRGRTLGAELFRAAGAVARSEIKPISDVRGSADFRLTLAGNILSKFWYDTFASEQPALAGAPDGNGRN
jgi:xanthine dehydrogenase small subunit